MGATMTVLEMVRDWLYEHGPTLYADYLDAHLKEDAERIEELRALLAETRNREGELSDELAELREAARRYGSHDMACGSRRPEETWSDECTCGFGQLIEEKP